MTTDTLYCDVSELVQPKAEAGASRSPVEVTRGAAMWVAGGYLRAVGPVADILSQVPRETRRVSLGGRAVVPGLVDSHTHAVFYGARIDEMARRCRGESYEQIAAAGGGIAASVGALQKASVSDLVHASMPRLASMLARGTTTCEVKSGYGLTPEAELKQLQAIAHLARESPIDILPTVLAHIVPPSHSRERDSYVQIFCDAILDEAAEQGLAAFVDVFVERGAFTPEEATRIAHSARHHGLGLKLHVDQLRDGHGAALAADLGALSADHLEHTGDEGARALAEASVTATILPACTLYLGAGPWPNGRKLRDAGCQVAVATDCNPGSSMVTDLPLAATLAATQCGLSLEESLWAITRGGAKALGLADRGRLVAGERADFLVLDHADWRSLLYQPGNPPIHQVVAGGQPVWPSASRD